MMKKLMLAFAAGMLAISIVAANLWLQLRDERKQNQQLRARVETAESTRAVTVSAPAAPAPRIAESPVTPSKEPVAPATASAAPAEAASKAANKIRDIFASPEGREMLRTQLRASLSDSYPDLARDLHLTPEEASKLLDVLVRQQLDTVTGSTALLDGGTPDNATIQQLARKQLEKTRSDDAEISAMLGSKYKQWQDYESIPSARQQVNRLRATLSSDDTPISDEDSKSLIAALAVEQGRITRETRNTALSMAGRDQQPDAKQQIELTTQGNQRLVQVASSYLSTRQLDSYKKMLDQNVSLARMLMGPQAGDK